MDPNTDDVNDNINDNPYKLTRNAHSNDLDGYARPTPQHRNNRPSRFRQFFADHTHSGQFHSDATPQTNGINRPGFNPDFHGTTLVGDMPAPRIPSQNLSPQINMTTWPRPQQSSAQINLLMQRVNNIGRPTALVPLNNQPTRPNDSQQGHTDSQILHILQDLNSSHGRSFATLVELHGAFFRNKSLLATEETRAGIPLTPTVAFNQIESREMLQREITWMGERILDLLVATEGENFNLKTRRTENGTQW
ncbi:hypothetical protein EJ08DRAFT_722417 [Tothia fuscella]|uniref:Uncharacterized protein n=1 Tax=Tothia fuscella TaxID=1048955 RepID=A0A9P4U1X4_9PEZI|nr:hypothetical protein EJ08DRAFT_722417 [Tothia fuscella]